MNFNPAPKKYPTWADMPKWDGTVFRKIVPGPWKQWFAWYPVKVHGQRVWLKTVCRRKTNVYVDAEGWTRYEYGTVFDLLKD